MLTCIARSKQPAPITDHESSSAVDHPPPPDQKPNTNAIKAISSQIKDMALKASGAYRHCAPCASNPAAAAQLESERFRRSFRRTGSTNSSSTTAGRRELEARLKGISSGEGTPASASGRRPEAVVFVEESEPKEWVAQVEPGVLITFVSLPRGGNDMKRIRFSREMFNKWQAQKWWADNCEKVMELYNVQRLNRAAFPLPSTTPHCKSEDDESSSKMGPTSIHNSPVTPSSRHERRLPRAPNSPSTDYDSYGVASSSTPKLSSLSGTKTEMSSTSTSMMTGSSRDVDCSGEISISNASYLETEWVEEDEAGVYITIRAQPDGRRELRRVRFSREKFGEVHARLWWEENRARVHKQYL